MRHRLLIVDYAKRGNYNLKRFTYPCYALVLLIPAAVMGLLTVFSSSAYASYTCDPNHCYAVYKEYSANASNVNGGTGITHYSFSNFGGGAYTSNDVVTITEGTDVDAQYNNEMWLIDDVTNTSTSHYCYLNYDAPTHTYSNQSVECWVETGYQKVGSGFTDDPNAGKQAWFISYTLPWDGYVAGVSKPYCDNHSPATGSCGYGNLYGSQLASGDYGVFGDLEIAYDGVTAHQMDTIADGNGGAGTYTDGTIPNVYLNPTVIQTGTELGGFSGTSAPKTHFKHNQYETSVGGSWSYQTLDGQVILLPSTSNLNGGWQTGGSYKPSNNTTGGIFDTCDQSGCAP